MREMATEPQPVGGTVQHNGFEVESNTETPEEMREVLGEESDESKAAAVLGKKGGEAAAAKRKLAPIPDRKAKNEDKVEDKQEVKAEVKSKTDSGKDEDKTEDKTKVAAKPDDDEDEPRPGETKEQIEARKAKTRARIEKATRETAEVKRRLAALDRENEELRRKISPQKPEPSGEPRIEDFEEPEKYLEARDAHNRQKWEREARAKQQNEEIQAKIQADVSKAQAAVAKLGGPKFLASLDHAVGEIEPSFVVIARGERPTAINALADEFFRAGDNAPRLMTYFSEHPEEIQRFSTLRPLEFVREMGKVEARLEAATADNPASTGEVSRARKPVRSVTGAPPGVGDDDDSQETDFDKYASKRLGNLRR